MKRAFIWRKWDKWQAGLVLLVLWLLMGCVPTSKVITIADTRIPATATATAPPTPTEAKTAAPALLVRWNSGDGRYELQPVDATTGQAIPGYIPLPLGGDRQYALQTALSADGRHLAAIESNGQACESNAGGTACRARADSLHLVDVAGWERVTAALPGDGWVSPLLFSPDGTRLALAYHNEAASLLMLFDAVTGIQQGQQSIPFRPTLMTFTDDGSLVVAGAAEGEKRGVTEPGPFTVQLLDGATLAEQWTQTLPEIMSGSWCTAECDGSPEQWRTESWQPAVVASPDGRYLYIVHANEDKLTTVDLDGRAVSTVPIQAAQSWLERLFALTAGTAAAKMLGDGASKSAVLSPDGQRLYVVGNSWYIDADDEGQPVQQGEFLGLQAVNTADGQLLQTKETTAEKLRITPDGAYLLLDGWDENGRWLEVWNAVTLENITRLEDREVTAVPLLDGGYALLASTTGGQQLYLSLMSPPRFKCAPVWIADGPIIWIAGH
jgi:DNA-binding beta-propeller fold protein YncE